LSGTDSPDFIVSGDVDLCFGHGKWNLRRKAPIRFLGMSGMAEEFPYWFKVCGLEPDVDEYCRNCPMTEPSKIERGGTTLLTATLLFDQKYRYEFTLSAVQYRQADYGIEIERKSH
jgi:hypothetical protein